MKLIDSIAQKTAANKTPANPAGKNRDGEKDPTIREF